MESTITIASGGQEQCGLRPLRSIKNRKSVEQCDAVRRRTKERGEAIVPSIDRSH